MKELIASVVDKETKQLKIIKAEYKTKKEFKEDLVGNGYSVHFIATEETFDDECTKYNERKETSIRRSKLMWASDKRVADKLGMTVKEYRAMVKTY